MILFPLESLIEVVMFGEVPKTAAPLPVSSVKAPERLAEVKELKEVVLPMEEMAPERLASVVTVAAFPSILVIPVNAMAPLARLTAMLVVPK